MKVYTIVYYNRDTDDVSVSVYSTRDKQQKAFEEMVRDDYRNCISEDENDLNVDEMLEQLGDDCSIYYSLDVRSLDTSDIKVVHSQFEDNYIRK